MSDFKKLLLKQLINVINNKVKRRITLFCPVHMGKVNYMMPFTLIVNHKKNDSENILN